MTFFRILPENFSFYVSEIPMTFFSHRPFFTISASNIIQISPISYCLHTLYPLYTHIHPDMLFSRLYALLSTLVTVNTIYAFYSFLLHHCTNSLSSLHIFVHHCTFCALR